MGRLSLAPASTALHGSAGRGDGAPCPVGPLGILTQRLQTQFLRNYPFAALVFAALVCKYCSAAAMKDSFSKPHGVDGKRPRSRMRKLRNVAELRNWKFKKQF